MLLTIWHGSCCQSLPTGKEDIITWGAQLLLLLTFFESQFEEDKICADFHNANNDKTRAGADSHKGFVQLGARSVLIQTGSCRGQQAIQNLRIVCIFEEECDIISSLIGNNRWCVVERVCTGQMSGNSELAHRVYSKVGVRHNSGVHISRSTLWASAWAVTLPHKGVNPTGLAL